MMSGFTKEVGTMENDGLSSVKSKVFSIQATTSCYS